MSKLTIFITLLIIILVQPSAAKMNSSKLFNPITQDPVERTNPIGLVYQDYMGVKNSLSRDRADSAAFFAAKLSQEIGLVTMDKLSSAQYDAWTKFATNLSNDADKIRNTKEIERQRECFMTLTNNMYELLKVFNTNSEIIYYQFCPMANKGKGAYWISDQSKIANPYFGKSMLRCGSTKATILVK